MRSVSFFEGIGIGALAMYLLDPKSGAARQALLREQAQSATQTVRQAEKDLELRAEKLLQEIERIPDDGPSDDKLAERVRSMLVYFLPSEVRILVEGGMVYMEGDVSPDQASQLVNSIKQIPGVLGIRNGLRIQRAEKTPELIASASKPILRFAFGIGLAAYGLTRKAPLGSTLGLTGVCIAAKALWRLEEAQDGEPIAKRPSDAEAKRTETKLL